MSNIKPISELSLFERFVLPNNNTYLFLHHAHGVTMAIHKQEVHLLHNLGSVMVTPGPDSLEPGDIFFEDGKPCIIYPYDNIPNQVDYKSNLESLSAEEWIAEFYKSGSEIYKQLNSEIKEDAAKLEAEYEESNAAIAKKRNLSNELDKILKLLE